MRTGKFERVRGFGFSQEEGMRDVVTGKAFGTLVKSRPDLDLKKLPAVEFKGNRKHYFIDCRFTSIS
jgi:hypothetical protein